MSGYPTSSPPSSAPRGMIWQWLPNGSYGQWTLVPDADLPLGYRRSRDFVSDERVLLPIYGTGAGGQGNRDGTTLKRPNFATGGGLGHVSEDQIHIPASGISPERNSVEGINSGGADHVVPKRVASDKFTIEKRDAGMFG
jgi:hypothetical protein